MGRCGTVAEDAENSGRSLKSGRSGFRAGFAAAAVNEILVEDRMVGSV